jgi:GDP-L-fucose synthase
MEKNSKIYVAGHTGLVGSSIMRALHAQGYKNLVFRDISELNLMDFNAANEFINKEKPEYVFLAAAKVGGILANSSFKADFIYQNLQIQNNVIHSSYQAGVKKLLFLGSSCIYPKLSSQPIKEEYFLSGYLEETNDAYAIAKIAGIMMCRSYNEQYGVNFISAMPTNLFGYNDNFDLNTSHVLPALIRKMHMGKCLEKSDWDSLRSDLDKRPVSGINGKASEKEIIEILNKFGIEKSNGKVTVMLWGTGMPKREFLFVEDLADALVYLMNNYNDNSIINVGTGRDITILKLALMIKEIIGFTGEINFDSSKPDGTPQKLLDVSKINGIGWLAKTSLKDGIESTYKWYLNGF